MTKYAAPPRDHFPIYQLLVACALLSIMVSVVGLFVGPYAWDDGAITLAFSKTFAETGRIALTPVSEQVEGFSTVSWFLINAAIALFHLDFEGTILAAQIASGVFLGIANIFVWLIAQKINLRADTTFATILILSIFGPAVSEVANGMEMTLLTASGLALVYALYFHFRENHLMFAIAAAIFLTSRFEATIYYAALLTPLIFQRRFRSFAILAAFGFMVVCLQEIVRYAIFQDLIPNTIHAKMHQPYSLSGIDFILSRIKGGLEVVLVFLPLILTLIGSVAFAPRVRKGLIGSLRGQTAICNDFIVLLAPIVAVVLFSILTGKVWGYVGRMQFLALPFILLMCGLIFDNFMNFGGLSIFQKRKATLLAVSAVTVLFSWLSWHQSGASALSTIAFNVAGKGNPVADTVSVTPDSYRKTGRAVDKIRQLAGLAKIVFLTPDIGGLGLCCGDIRVVDIALLTNRRLARDGYHALPEVFSTENPDVLEVHGPWAALSNIYNSPEFNAKYQAALVNGTPLYVRNDIAESLSANSYAKYCRINSQCLVAALKTHRYVNQTNRDDDIAFLRRGQVLIIHE
jgi:hypothetical protein